MNNISIYTDGGFNQRTGLGSWAYMVMHNGRLLSTRSGAGFLPCPDFTELVAVVNALQAVPPELSVNVFTDSQWVIRTAQYMRGPEKQKEWMLLRRIKSAEYAKLLLTFQDLLATRKVGFLWVKGHNGDPFNEWCDQECRRAVESALKADEAAKAQFKHALSIFSYGNSVESYPDLAFALETLEHHHEIIDRWKTQKLASSGTQPNKRCNSDSKVLPLVQNSKPKDTGIQMFEFKEHAAETIAINSPLKKELLVAIDLAHQALRMTQDHVFNSSFKTYKKPDGTVVTDIDIKAHDIIQRGIKNSFPVDSLVSEEGELPPWNELKSAGRIWMVDPLDGTSNLVDGFRHYCVNIALLAKTGTGEHIPVLGVIAAPSYNQIFVALMNCGTWLIDLKNQTTERLIPPAVGDQHELKATYPYHAVREQVLKFMSENPTTVDVKDYKRFDSGAALRFTALARGQANILVIPYAGYAMWDVAAGDALYRYSVADGEPPRKSPLHYDFNSESWQVPAFAMRV